MLEATRQPYRDYMSTATLMRRAGCTEADLALVAGKEIVDNAYDISPQRCPAIEITAPTIRVRDFGDGLSEAKVLELFSLKRAAMSSKRWRQARRGALGNGLRVVMGVVYCSGGTIDVESRGQGWRLEVGPDGNTRTARHFPSEVHIGTAVTLTVGPELPFDADSIQAYADDCEVAKGVAFGGSKAVPQWFGRATIIDLMHDVDPMVSALEFARQFDLTAEALAAIKKLAMRSTVAELLVGGPLDAVVEAIRHGGKEPRELHKIGRNAIEADGYGLASNWIYTHTDGAEMPIIAECWAYSDPVKDRRTGGEITVQTVFVNRVPALEIGWSWGRVAAPGFDVQLTVGNVQISIPASESGLKGPCAYYLNVALTCPEFRFISEGKTPDLSGLGKPLAAAIGQALKRAYKPPSQTIAESREQDREDRPKPEPKPKPDPHQLGQLGQLHADLIEEYGLDPDEMRVMSEGFDPYALDNRANRARAEWLAETMAALGLTDRVFHVRGLFYALVSSPSVVRPDGARFINTHANYRWLGDTVRYARWLGVVPFWQIIDERNTPPRIEWAAARHFRFRPSAGADAEHAALPRPGRLAARWDEEQGFPGRRQPFRLGLLGEKTGLEPVLRPLAERFGADLYLPSGEPSITMVHDMAEAAARDGRKLILFTFCDFDPTGNNIPATTARRLQALRDLLYPELEFEVRIVALTEEQVRDLGLPSTPLKASESRAPEWEARYPDLEQTEIDALSTLRPEVLVEIAEDAIAPFFDADLPERQAQAEADWQARADAVVEAAEQADPALRAIGARMAGMAAAMQEAIDRYNEVADEWEQRGEAVAAEITLPVFITPKPETEEDGAPPPLAASEMDRIDFIEVLRGHMIRKRENEE